MNKITLKKFIVCIPIGKNIFFHSEQLNYGSFTDKINESTLYDSYEDALKALNRRTGLSDQGSKNFIATVNITYSLLTK